VTRVTPEVLFAGVPVANFDRAVSWYTQFFGRPADVVAHDREVMWRVVDGGWLYVVADSDRAGHSVVTIAVADLDRAVREVTARGIAVGPTEDVGGAGRKATMLDPDGNLIALIHVAD
jgi:glyoxylase I family protein